MPTTAVVLPFLKLCPSNERLNPAVQQSQYTGLAVKVFGGHSDVQPSTLHGFLTVIYLFSLLLLETQQGTTIYKNE